MAARCAGASQRRVPFVLGVADDEDGPSVQERKDQVLDERVLAAHLGHAGAGFPARVVPQVVDKAGVRVTTS